MMKHSKRLAAALALMVAPTLATAETVKVGVVMTYSGGGAQFAQQIERAMDLYMEQEGKAKLGEHEIELVKRDAKTPGGDVAKTAVQELIVREDVDLLTGFVYSPNIIASAPLIDQAKVPTLVLNAATAWIPSLSPYIARVSMTMWQTGYPMGGYAAEKLECETAACSRPTPISVCARPACA
jgi:branched-chain amino acid transport system substrate-binding protein